MLPFLKHKQEAIAGGPDDEIMRKPDEEEDYEMLDAIAEDILTAVSKKDVKLLKEALTSLVEHIKEEDKEQDAQTYSGEV